MRATITYDGSFPGLFTVLYDIYLLKINQPIIRSRFDHGTSLFNDEVEIVTDNFKSEKVLVKLQKLLNSKTLQKLYKVYLSEKPNSEDLVIQYCIKAIDHGKDVILDYGDPVVSGIEKIVKMVNRERHRMNAFIRFKEIEKDHYFAKCEPDFDVLPLISTHFKNRYQDQIWTIYDKKRNYGIHFDLSDIHQVTFQTNAESNSQNTPTLINYVNEKEQCYETLWKTYFEKVNIGSRKNTKLFRQHMPERYWKYLSELH